MSDQLQESQEQPTGLRYWAPLIAAAMALFIVVIDSTMMNVAVPTIVKDLNTTVTAVQSVIALYALVMAALMLVGGKLGSIYGVKRIFIIGVIIYGIGTLVAAVAWNITVLAIGWSLLEGVGAALILPMAYTLIVANYEGRQRTLGYGVLGGVQASAAAIGPILGGILTSFLTWRLGFAGEVIIAIAILPFAWTLKEIRTAEEGDTIDWGGAALQGFGLLLIVQGLSLAGRFGWIWARRPFTIGNVQINPFGLSPTPMMVAGGLILLAIFLHWQRRRERREETPLVRVRILSNGVFLTGVSTMLFQAIVLMGTMFVLPLYLQGAAGYTAFESGVAILPFSAATFIFSLAASGWGERIAPKRLIQIGGILLAVGILLLIRVVSLNITIGEMIIPMAVFGTGMGILVAHLVNLILSAVDPVDTPEASGVNNSMSQVGNALGTAIIGSMLLAFFFGNVVDSIAIATDTNMTPQQRDTLVVELEDARDTTTTEQQQAFLQQMPAEVREELGKIFDGSMVKAMNDTLVLILFLILAMFLLSSFLPSEKVKPLPPEQKAPLTVYAAADQ